MTSPEPHTSKQRRIAVVILGLLATAIGLGALAGGVDALEIRTLADAESTHGWGSSARVTPDSAEGDRAIVVDFRAGSTGFLSLDFRDTGIDLSSAYALSFWWKMEGAGAKDFKLKVRNYPLVDGMEAVYDVWDRARDGGPAGTWRQATVLLSEPQYDSWGGSPNTEQRYLNFRCSMGDTGDARLYIDAVKVLPQTFAFSLGDPMRESAEVADIDFDGDGSVGFGDFVKLAVAFGTVSGDDAYDAAIDLDADGAIGFSDFVAFSLAYGSDGTEWRVPVTLTNVSGEGLSVTIGNGGLPLQTIALMEGETRTETVALPALSVSADARPLQGTRTDLWMQVENLPETRVRRSVLSVEPPELSDHPRLLFDEAGIVALKTRVGTQDWARERWESVLRDCDRTLTERVDLPPRGGNWSHWYASPTTGANLVRGEQIGPWQWKHIDPLTGEVFLGNPNVASQDYDGVTIMTIHSRWSRRIRDLGIAYRATGDTRYADKAREILMAYADKYPTYPLHNTQGDARIGGGRVGSQTLNEAVWLIAVAQGADLIWDRLSESDRTHAAEDLFLPAVREVILPHEMGVHNIQCWKNSAVGLVGFLLGDAELMWEAIENPVRGYRVQMRNGVTADGLWWESAWGYHVYTMSAIWPLAEAARNNGIDLYGDGMRRMYLAPVRFASPTLELPAFNDSDARSVAGESLFEIGYARYGEPDMRLPLTTQSRKNDYALWFGAADGSTPVTRAAASVNYPASGYTIMTRGTGSAATWLCLDYGPHGGGHGHPDKLGFVLAARGATVGIDPGTTRYGLASQNGWYRTTIAHNTLTVDETSQAPAEGRVLAFGQSDLADYVVAEAGDIYPGVRFVRSIAMVDSSLIVFIDQIQGTAPHTYDLALHLEGTWWSRPTNAWAPPDKDGYRYLRDGRREETSNAADLRVQVRPGWLVGVTLAGGEPTEVMTASAPLENEEDRMSMALFRRQATSTAYAWAVSLSGAPVGLQWVEARDTQGDPVDRSRGAAVRVDRAGGSGVTIVANPGGVSLEVGGRLTSARFDITE